MLGKAVLLLRLNLILPKALPKDDLPFQAATDCVMRGPQQRRTLACARAERCSLEDSECVAADVQVYPGRTALVVSLENITENVYLGNQRSMTIPNCLFRLGGAAVLLSNRRRHWWTARCVTSQA